MLQINETHFNSLARQNLGCGYYPKLSKIVLIVHMDNLEAGKLLSAGHGFKVCRGAHNIGSYIMDDVIG